MLDIVRQLQQRDIQRLPIPQLDNIKNACERLGTLIKRVREFDIAQSNPATVCNQIIDEVKKAYDSITEPLLLPLAFTATQATDYARIEREAKGFYTTMKTEQDKHSAFIEKSRGETEKAMSAIKDQAAKAGVSRNAVIFLEDSTAHKKLAKNWLIATIVVSALTFVAAVASFYYSNFVYQPATIQDTIQFVASKLIVLSIMSFVIFWCTKNYKSQKHNETLNKHRANALMTFNAFVEGSADQRVKDAILLQAAQAAFACRPTGFDAPENETQVINPFVDILGKTIVKPSE